MDGDEDVSQMASRRGKKLRMWPVLHRLGNIVSASPAFDFLPLLEIHPEPHLMLGLAIEKVFRF